MAAARSRAVNTGRRLLALAAFFSPTLYCLVMVLIDNLQLPAPPEILVASLFFLIPVVALMFCGHVLWVSSKTLTRRIGWVIFTFSAMMLQVALLLLIIIAAISAAIGYAQ